MKSQYLHFGAFARFSSRSNAISHASPTQSKPTFRGVLGEALRVPSRSKHVLRDHGRILPPRILQGSKANVLDSVAAWVADQNRNRCNAQRPRLRRDSPVMIALMASYPERLKSDDGQPTGFNHESDQSWQQWLRLTRHWLDELYGERVRLVVAHMDETCPHLHIFLVSQPGEGLEAIHPALAGLPRELNRGPGRRAVESGNVVQWQDAFFEAVSKRCGHERKTAGRSRRRVKESRLERQLNDAVSQHQNQVARLRLAQQVLQKRERDATDLQLELDNKRQEFVIQQNKLTQTESRLQREREICAELDSALKGRADILNDKLLTLTRQDKLYKIFEGLLCTQLGLDPSVVLQIFQAELDAPEKDSKTLSSYPRSGSWGR
ncbi:hypothetical protein [Silvimonas soli]|uniref:hypothetical protein n=1 Tax=Silvimonas soli TaxID=2980100 RepID=UPI0024B365EE|nr:hypothetical protein [Silvimonas soli]